MHLAVVKPGEDAAAPSLAAPRGFVARAIDGRRCRTKAALLDALAHAFALSRGHGPQLGRDRGGARRSRVAPRAGLRRSIVTDADVLLERSPDDYRIFVAMLEDVAREWATPRDRRVAAARRAVPRLPRRGRGARDRARGLGRAGSDWRAREDDMRFTWFNLMPWPHLPDDFREKNRSVWVDIPNTLYDPRKGHRVYHEYMDQLEYAETLGFDGIGVNEHHQNGYGLMPSPNLIAAGLARRTSRAAICVIGNSIALYNPPIRVAEEFAMLDVSPAGGSWRASPSARRWTPTSAMARSPR